MKKLFGSWNPEEARRFHAPVQNMARYVIFKYADTQYTVSPGIGHSS
jgi:hypothetical protein